MSKIKIMNAFQIKLIMAFLMFLNHLHFVNNLLPPGVTSFFNIISRCVAPMFAFLAVEGILHTRDLKKYCLRLSLFAGGMFIGNAAVNTIFKMFTTSLTYEEQKSVLIRNMDNNIFFTLAFGVLAIALIQWGKEKQESTKAGYYLLSVVCFSAGFYGEWGSVIIPFMFLQYFFRDKKAIRYVGYVVIEIISIYFSFGEPFWFIVFPFILLYNGERGPKTNFSKYFFYIFYPAHIWILYIINLIITLVK